MAEDKFEQAKGNNKELEKDGKGDKASGKAKEAVENVKEKANDVIDKFKGNKGD